MINGIVNLLASRLRDVSRFGSVRVDCNTRMWDVGRGYGMWDVGRGMWDVRCGMWDVGCEMWDLGCGMWDAGRRMENVSMICMIC